MLMVLKQPLIMTKRLKIVRESQVRDVQQSWIEAHDDLVPVQID